MINIENENIEKSGDITSDELIELKKQLAKEITDKLMEKNSDSVTSIIKWSMRNYLVDENTLIDTIHDEIILWWLWELTWLITPSLKKYREMFSKANTKNELENLRTTIFNEIWWNEQAPIPTQEALSNTTYESIWNTKETENQNEEISKQEWWEIQSYNSSKETSKKGKNKDEKKDWIQEGLDKEKKTYTNPKSGLTFNIYDQCDPRRWSHTYKKGTTTMRKTGCLLTSAAVIHSAIDPSITPDFYRKNYAGRFAYDSVPKATQHKIEAKKLTIGSNTVEEIINHLKKWYPVNFMVHGPRHGGKNPYHRWQHYMTAVDVRGEPGNEEIFVANTYDGKWSGRYPAHKKLISVKEASLYTPSQA